ncbi:DAK2 domain-containing protein [Tessaracoccus antarcticus]|uniref:DAK2 domain-containing protein n=1 Tax=Tessaracoccus antarcticus TaxID=2479848 RepID=A0A3M0GGH4_9ACTN|nr:DAK2 domain-containing protein [Tessaracoccus antarcticus]RMB61812.1 DAK2 domain-containing protein [Tessaracoccus antarcticus]
MDGKALQEAISRCLTVFAQSADELGDLDQALGDGDLGITVSLGAKATNEALAKLGDDTTPTEVLLTCAKAFANANPSTMAALVAGGLLAGSRTINDAAMIGPDQVGPFIQAVAQSISQRGKSQLGDKTILDAMFPAAEAYVAGLEKEPLAAAIEAAREGVERSTGLQSRRGRASWMQERSIGLQDPGATGFLRFLEAWQQANS